MRAFSAIQQFFGVDKWFKGAKVVCPVFNQL
jgi:hypothetical protein